MKIISTRAHGIYDYIIGIIITGSPWLFGFAAAGAETWIPVFLGIGGIAYSLFTRYELSISPVISMRTHLWLDILSGILLASSPWLFGFRDFVYMPHLILGVVIVGTAVITNPDFDAEVRTHEHSK
jgi:hypothetical protein